jgi:hypothetical protein
MNILLARFGGAAVRHFATAAGGYLVAQGVIDEQSSSQIIGAIVTVGGLGLSWVQKVQGVS